MVGAIALAVAFWMAACAVSFRLVRKLEKKNAEEIAILKRENLACAKAFTAQKKVVDDLQKDRTILLDCQQGVADHENRLTFIESRPKIEPKPVAVPKRVNWKQAQAALEKASEPQEAE
jgi:hypothetical protein